jgi:hypothetical protein
VGRAEKKNGQGAHPDHFLCASGNTGLTAAIRHIRLGLSALSHYPPWSILYTK